MEKMKTSNKILTIFLGIVAFYFLVFALDLRLFGIHRDDRVIPELKSHVIPLKSFKYIKLIDVTSLELSPASSDEYFIEIKHSSDTTQRGYVSEATLQSIEPIYSGDTIVLKGNKDLKPYFGNFIISIPASLQSISADHSHFRMNGFKSDSLKMELDDSEIRGLYLSTISKLNVLARNKSKVFINDKYQIDTLNITLENSRANYYKPLKQLNGIVDKKSKLDVRHVDDIRVRKEKGSMVDFR